LKYIFEYSSFNTIGKQCFHFVKCRWDESAIHLLPEYMKDFYILMLETFQSFEDALGPEKSYRVLYLKQAASIILHIYTLLYMSALYVLESILKEHTVIVII
jgi:hypothetical protein